MIIGHKQYHQRKRISLSLCLCLLVSLSFSPDAHKKETLFFFFLISSIFHSVCEANREENKKELEEEEIQQRERERSIIVRLYQRSKPIPHPQWTQHRQQQLLLQLLMRESQWWIHFWLRLSRILVIVSPVCPHFHKP